jgi:3-methyladenine DNA glycosylase Tag
MSEQIEITDRKIKPADAQAIQSMTVYWSEVINRGEKEAGPIFVSELAQLMGMIGTDVILSCVARDVLPRENG